MENFILQNLWIIWLAVIWTIPWKGVALWKAAKNGDKIWFVVLFIFNTLAILEIIYIFAICRKQNFVPDPKNGYNGNGNNLIRGL